MKRFMGAWVLVLASLAAHASDASGATDLEGWWVAEAQHAGQTTPIYLRFSTEGDKRIARLSLPVVDAWDFPIGPFKESGNRVEFPGVGWSIGIDSDGTLSGVLPEQLVPVHRIAVTFSKTVAPAVPKPSKWMHHPRPRVKWSREIAGPVWAGLALDEHAALLVAATDAGSVVAFDPRTGAPRWTATTGGKVRATPTLTPHHIYAASDDGHLYKWDKRTGREVWKAKIDGAGLPRIPSFEPKSRFDRYASGAVERDGRVYVGSRDGAVYALDAQNGRTLWRYATGDLVMATPAVRGNLVLVGSFDKHAYALDSRNGALKWKRDLRGEVPADIVIVDGRALVGTRAYDMLALDCQTGEPLWDQYVWFSWIESVPVVKNGLAYVGSSDAVRLFAFDVGSGARAWEARIPGYGWSRPALGGDAVYIGTVGQTAGIGQRTGAVVSFDRKTGAMRWLHPAARPDGAREWGFASSVAVANARERTVYAVDLTGKLYALAD